MPGFADVRALALVAFGAALVPAPAPAQTPGLPVFAGGMVPGLELGAAVGRSPARGPVGRAWTWVGNLEYGSRRLGFRLTAGALDPAGGTAADLTAGALGTVRLFEGGVNSPLSVDLLGGYGFYNGPETLWRQAVAAAAFVLTIPTPLVSVRPWLAPRLDWHSASATDGSELESALGGSAGIDLRFFGGLVLRAAWDKIEGAARVIGFGAGYHF